MTEATAQRTPRERRLRRALIVVSLLAGLMALLVAGVIVYWLRFVLPVSSDPFTRGPYVTRLGTTDATLSWHIPGRHTVHIVATTPDGRTVTDVDGHLTGLTPGARQPWVASVDGRAVAWGAVTTAATDPAAPVRFTAFGDYGAGGDAEYAVARVAAAQDPAFTAVPGDNSYLVAAPVLFDHNIFRPMRPLLAEGPFVATLGEHDLAYGGGGAVASALGLPNGGDRYVFTHGGVRIIALGLEMDAGDVPFVRAALARPGARHTYLLVHRPPAPANPVLAVARGHVVAVIAGHNHRYERRVIGGIPEFTLGTGGAPRSEGRTPRSADAKVSLETYGVLRVDDTPRRVVCVFLDDAGAVRDRVVLPG
ncbi:MAG: hypothetical protein U0Y82_11295 [Thermoleophilia bacterium]